MSQTAHFRPLYDASGELHAVLLSAELWARCGSKLEPLIRETLEEISPSQKHLPASLPEPLSEWEEFQRYWDFKYPFEASVSCSNCGIASKDWLHDAAKPFRLKSAQIGGLVVFHCNNCGATVRKKHFKDHICFECSPDRGAGR